MNDELKTNCFSFIVPRSSFILTSAMMLAILAAKEVRQWK
jgi:hypothetical protein